MKILNEFRIEIRLYIKMIKMHWLAGLEYKGWWMMAVQTLFNSILDPICTFFLFSRFGNIGEWTFERIILIYSISVASFGLAETFCRGFDYFPWRMIRSGDFDRLLLRPRSLFSQVASSYFHIHRLSRVAAGIGVIIWSLNRQGVGFSPFSTAVILLALIGGALMYSGVFVMSSGIAFFTIKALDWIYIFTNASYHTTRCPIDYMPRLMKNAFTFVMPMLVISYYPASVVCNWGEHTFMGFLALPAGIAFLAVSILIWRIGVKHYSSTGS